MWVCHSSKYDSFHGEFAQIERDHCRGDEHDAAGGLGMEEVAERADRDGALGAVGQRDDSSSRGLAQLEPLDLAGGGLRQLVHEHHA